MVTSASNNKDNDEAANAAERKRKRLEAWRKRQKEGSSLKKVANTREKISVSLNTSIAKKIKLKKPASKPVENKVSNVNILGDDDDEGVEDKNVGRSSMDIGDVVNLGSRWKPPSAGSTETKKPESSPEKKLPEINKGKDLLDEFMTSLESENKVISEDKELMDTTNSVAAAQDTEEAHDSEDEEEQEARRNLIAALASSEPTVAPTNHPPELKSELKSQKHQREEHIKKLTIEAEKAKKSIQATQDIGILYNDYDSGVVEEAERELQLFTAAPDALEMLAELNKKKELKSVDHSKISYLPINKNLYIVPRALQNVPKNQLNKIRNSLSIKVRGLGAPVPIEHFHQSGLPERILAILANQNITKPFPIQAQCLPIIMMGRDCIGIAKTGSGKTLAYLLPMLRHILDQVDLQVGESGPIGLILAPARELAVQIYSVCKLFTKHLNLKCTAVYGGAGVAEQIADLKRGVHISVATPGRMIDILTMQSGKLLSLQRVSYVVLDEADRMFDMGFAPQISAILSAIRPDRQTVLFSATFPKTVENLAKKSLKVPIEVIIGGRSVASDSVTQFAELVPEEDKFLRLLQLLGEHTDDNKKVIIFVDTQLKADAIFEQLIRCGYSSVSLHGGKDQEDRDSTIADFKLIGGPNVLVATSVAGRGLDVPSCACVINYSAPNHVEDYVHRIGRTGRAENKGISYTFVNPSEEAKFAPVVVKAMTDANQVENISDDLLKLSDSYKEKVSRGEAKWAGSGFKGKGYTYDSSELNDAQKLARLEKREALIEAGLLDPDEDEPNANIFNDDDDYMENEENFASDTNNGNNINASTKNSSGYNMVLELQNKMSKDVLNLPGMQEAILRKAGLNPSQADLATDTIGQLGPNHFVDEIEINDYPREARWKVTQKETTSRLQDDFQTAVTLKGEYYPPNKVDNSIMTERKLYLHLEATTERNLKNCVYEIRRLLNEETLRVGLKGTTGSSRYNVLG